MIYVQFSQLPYPEAYTVHENEPGFALKIYDQMHDAKIEGQNRDYRYVHEYEKITPAGYFACCRVHGASTMDLNHQPLAVGRILLHRRVKPHQQVGHTWSELGLIIPKLSTYYVQTISEAARYKTKEAYQALVQRQILDFDAEPYPLINVIQNNDYLRFVLSDMDIHIDIHYGPTGYRFDIQSGETCSLDLWSLLDTFDVHDQVSVGVFAPSHDHMNALIAHYPQITFWKMDEKVA